MALDLLDQFLRLISKLDGPAFDTARDILRLNQFFEVEYVECQYVLLALQCHGFGPHKALEALPIEALVVQYSGIVDTLPEVDLFCGVLAEQSQTNQQLLVQVGFEIGQLGALDGWNALEDGLLVVAPQTTDLIKELEKENIIRALVPGYKEPETPFLCLGKAINELQQIIGSWCGHCKCLFYNRLLFNVLGLSR